LAIFLKRKQDRQSTHNATLRRVRATIVAVEKQQVLHIPSVRLQPLVPSAKSACAVLPSVAIPALLYFSTLSHNRHDFLKKSYYTNKMCVLIFSTTFA
jgi:hypothetical protein